MSRISFDNVVAGYADRDVLHGVDASVAAGEWLAVIGPNGSGKSTLLKVGAGLIAAPGGVAVDGVNIDRMGRGEVAKLIAYVPQTPVIPPGTTVRDYVLLGRNPHIGYWRRETRHDITIAVSEINRLDLGPLSDRRLDSLSGGERQRAVLARALTQRPAVLLLDEPTTGLDLGHQQQFLANVDEMRSALGIAVVAALHDLTLAAQYTDRLLLLADGRVVASGSARDVLTEERLRRTYHADVTVLTDERGRPVVVPRRLDQPTAASKAEPTT
jgi:iron complex transport system ATP-binding protein